MCWDQRQFSENVGDEYPAFYEVKIYLIKDAIRKRILLTWVFAAFLGACWQTIILRSKARYSIVYCSNTKGNSLAALATLLLQ